MPAERVKDRNDEDIHEGDTVGTRYRGGVREGEVDKIVTDEQQAKKEDVKNPPKVIFNDQHGHRVAHNPQTLEKK